MSRTGFRFSIRAILITTAYAAIALAALANPSKAWLGVSYGITLLLLFYSLLGAIYRTDRARAYWTGFAVFGFGYLAIIFGPFTGLSSKLPTTLLLEYAQSKLHTAGGWYSYPPLYSTSSPIYYPPSAVTYSTPATPSISLPTSTTPVPVDEVVPEDDAEATDESETTGYVGSPVNPNASPSPSLTPVPTTYYPPTNANGVPSPYLPSPSSYEPYAFSEIGQSVCALVLAAIGGVIAQCLFAVKPTAKPQ